jgi:GAF domain-containing protein
MTVDPASLQTAFRELMDRPVSDGSTVELLRQAVGAAAGMPGVSGAGLMLLDTEQALRYVAASDQAGRILELSQEEAAQGPCIDSLVRNDVVATADLRTDPRWPRLTPLLASSPVRAVLGMPVHLSGGAVGTFNVYADHPHDWERAEISALGAYVDVVDSLLASTVARQHSEQLAQQLQYALDYRVIIERAIGYLMCHDQVDEVTAFTRLRSAARGQRRKVVDLAYEVVNGQPLQRPARPDGSVSRRPLDQ